MKVLSITGARPNYIKLAAICEVFSRFFEHVVVDTGQHYDYEMNRVFFDQLSIPEPHYFLGVGSGSHGYQVGEVIKRVEEVLLKEKPNIVVVYGDTNSALGGALATVKAGLRVVHVEAGLRSFDMSMPEEINRRVIDHISTLLFAPTKTAVNNLLSERVPGKVYFVGDVHVYTLRKWLPIAEEKSNILAKLGLKPDEYVLVTLHRAENVDNIMKLSRLLQLINKVAEYYKVIFPVHPRTRKNMVEAKLDIIISKNNNIILTQPLGYIDFIKVLNHTKLVLTDSGGVQREAYLLKKPVIVLRKTTEWVELVELGWVMLYDVEREVNLEQILGWKLRGYVEGLLGDETAPQKIAEIIYHFLQKQDSKEGNSLSFIKET
uniref:UDP-N-acetylglucosamine 2-epimerase (Non-hydrolyzing) n=1 Tax=Ignisphaera aggregans TaxID=334771 RepID=A0A7C5UTG6_9CREN